MAVSEYIKVIEERAQQTGLASMLVSDILIDVTHLPDGSVEFSLTDGFEAVSTLSFEQASAYLEYALTH